MCKGKETLRQSTTQYDESVIVERRSIRKIESSMKHLMISIGQSQANRAATNVKQLSEKKI